MLGRFREDGGSANLMYDSLHFPLWRGAQTLFFLAGGSTSDCFCSSSLSRGGSGSGLSSGAGPLLLGCWLTFNLDFCASSAFMTESSVVFFWPRLAAFVFLFLSSDSFLLAVGFFLSTNL